MKRLVFSAVLAAACNPPSHPEPPRPPAPSASAPAPAPSHTYHLKPIDRWKHEDAGGLERFTDPDGAVTVTAVESSEPDLAKAIAAAWALASPKMALPERQRASPPANERFQKQLVVSYDDDAHEHVAQAIAMQHAFRAERVYVFLIEGPAKAVNKRAAEIGRIMTSLEVDDAKALELDAAKAKPLDEARRAAWFDFVERERAMAGVPGAAAALVTKDGVFTRGFGVRAEGSEAVDADTQFMIGSVTKSFSTLLLAELVDAGVIRWDEPVREAYPDFRLADEGRSKAIQMQHLFCACVGAPRQDMEMLFEFAGKKPADLFHVVATMQLTSEFGETFQYNNQLTAAGGFIAAHAALPKESDFAKAYARVLRERVLDKLAMSSSTLDPAEVVRRGNYALPHRLDWGGGNEKLDLGVERFALPIAPGGALWSTANDMAKYLQLQLSRGVLPSGERLVSEANLGRTQTAQVKVSDKQGYGMGWLVGRWRGLSVIEHSGATMGFNSDLVVFPDLGLGMFIVANRSPGAMATAARERLSEILFELDARAEGALGQRLSEMRRLEAEEKAKVAAQPVPDELAGRYTNARLGAIELKKGAAGMTFDAGEWHCDIGVFNPDERPNTLLLTSGPLQGITFQPQKQKDGKSALLFKAQQSEYLFERK